MASHSPLPPFLPMSRREVAERGWDALDIIFVTGDAYVDHPSFPTALLGRMLEADGFRVGVISRPRVEHPDDVAALGEPRLFFALAPGAVDSMINNFTAQKRRRRTDEYASGGVGGGRPDRALIVYANLLRRVFGKGAPILAGGVEASLRRFAHYDFWDDAVRRPVLLDAPADALVYGMGERPLREIARAMREIKGSGAFISRKAEEKVSDTFSANTLRDKDLAETGPGSSLGFASVVRAVRGVVWRCAASEKVSDTFSEYHALPSVERVQKDPKAQVRAFIEEIDFRKRGVYQDCAGHRVVANPPAEPLSTEELDAIYALPFRRQAHPSQGRDVPALEQVRFSVTSHRGCFGGCAFCGISTHQGKTVQSRSRESILAEVRRIAKHPQFDGTIRDIGGPTANMWRLSCKHGTACARASCLAPRLCKHLETDARPYVALLEEARKVKGVRHLFISSGVRMDLALECEPFIEAFAGLYTSGYAKVAPEHIAKDVLDVMMKPDGAVFRQFLHKFRVASARAGKEQYVLPYFIAAHPGCTLEHMVDLALFLKEERLRVEQCQIFIPIPGTASAVMYATGINPFTGKPVFVERDVRRREMQKALVLYHLPASRHLVSEALRLCGRSELEGRLLTQRPMKPRTPGRRYRG